MPYARPTKTQLIAAAVQDVLTSDLTDANGNVVAQQLLAKSVLRVLAKSQAGLAWEEYGYLDWIALQSNPFTATDEFALAWGNLKGVYLKDATATVATAAFPGVSGTPCPAGTVLTADDGTAYATSADTTVNTSGTLAVTFTALTAGAASNFTVGSSISLQNPIPGISADGVWTSTIKPGTDQEAMDAFKTRYLQQYAAPPQGGAVGDYEEWALQVPGVTRAWDVPNGFGAGTVVVYTMWDVTEVSAGGFPQGTNGVAASDSRAPAATGDQLVVANYLLPLQPVTALVYSCAPVPFPVPFTITNLANAASATLQAAVAASLAGMFLRKGDPKGSLIYQSDWEQAIAAAVGSSAFTVTSPVQPIAPAIGYLPVLGSVSFAP